MRLSKRTILQIIAMTTMLVDHVGAVIFPEQIGLRMIGRLAYPIYIYLFVRYSISEDTTHNHKQSLRMLTVLFIVSQTPFAINFYNGNIFKEMNIILVFISVYSLHLLSVEQNKRRYMILFALSSITYVLLSPMNIVSLYTLSLAITMLYAHDSLMPLTFFMILGNGIIMIVTGSDIGFLSILSLPIIAFVEKLEFNERKPSEVYLKLYRWFYPLHLFALSLIEFLLK